MAGATHVKSDTVPHVDLTYSGPSARRRIDELLEQLAQRRSSVAVLASSDPDTLAKMVDYLVASFHAAYPDARDDLWRVAPPQGSWSVEDVRTLILSRVVSQPRRTNVVVIERADTFAPRAADRLLTVLEQPPAPTLWVLCTTSPSALSVTIRSRVSTTIVSGPTDAAALLEFTATSTPTLRAYDLASALPAGGEGRLAARAILDGFRGQLAALVPSAASPRQWHRLRVVAAALDTAEEILRTNGTPVTALALVLRAVGPDELPAAVRFDPPAAPARPREVRATFADADLASDHEPSWIPSPSNDPRWSPGPPFVPAIRRRAPRTIS